MSSGYRDGMQSMRDRHRGLANVTHVGAGWETLFFWSGGSRVSNRLNVPNIVTLFRMLLGVASAGLVYAVGIPHRFEDAACGLAIATTLDLLDGPLARRLGGATRLGAVLDPLADKIVANLFFCVLVHHEVFAWWLVGLAVARDVLVQFGRIRAASRGLIIQTFRVSDIRNALQITAVILGLLSLSPVTPHFPVPAITISAGEVANALFVFGLVLGYVGLVVFFAAYWRTCVQTKAL